MIKIKLKEGNLLLTLRVTIVMESQIEILLSMLWRRLMIFDFRCQQMLSAPSLFQNKLLDNGNLLLQC